MDNTTIIDAVITWVDGEDPHHIAKRNQILAASGVKAQSRVSASFISVNEIAYCVESIIKYAPFIRTIFIVTDEQIPEIYYAYPDRIKIIDHKDIFRGHDVLPTINIFSIECMLYCIPGLAENFIYFNDDFFLIKPTKPEDWFINEFPVIRGRWETHPEKIWHKRISSWFGIKSDTRAGFRKTQSTAAKLIGYDNRYFRCYHTPRALRKSTYENFFTENPELLAKQIQYRKRHASQFNPYSLAWHLEIKNNTMHYSPSVGIMELHHPDRKSVGQTERMLRAAEKNSNTICANIQNVNLASIEQQQIIFNWLNRVIPRGQSHMPGINQKHTSNT